MEDRRTHRRYLVWFPVRLNGPEGVTLAVSKDISLGGMLLASAGELELGSPVKVSFQVQPADSQPHQVEGKIVRITENDADPHGTWRYKVAVQFEDTEAVLEQVLERAQETSQAESGLDRPSIDEA